jgi:hypothetical protein
MESLQLASRYHHAESVLLKLNVLVTAAYDNGTILRIGTLSPAAARF